MGGIGVDGDKVGIPEIFSRIILEGGGLSRYLSIFQGYRARPGGALEWSSSKIASGYRPQVTSISLFMTRNSLRFVLLNKKYLNLFSIILNYFYYLFDKVSSSS